MIDFALAVTVSLEYFVAELVIDVGGTGRCVLALQWTVVLIGRWGSVLVIGRRRHSSSSRVAGLLAVIVCSRVALQVSLGAVRPPLRVYSASPAVGAMWTCSAGVVVRHARHT